MGGQEADYRKTLSVDSVPLDESGLRELLVCSVIILYISQPLYEVIFIQMAYSILT